MYEPIELLARKATEEGVEPLRFTASELDGRAFHDNFLNMFGIECFNEVGQFDFRRVSIAVVGPPPNSHYAQS